MYSKGKGVIQDYVQAYMWANLAASNGIKDASKLRDIFEQKMTPTQISEAQKLEGEWLKKHWNK